MTRCLGVSLKTSLSGMEARQEGRAPLGSVCAGAPGRLLCLIMCSFLQASNLMNNPQVQQL